MRRVAHVALYGPKDGAMMTGVPPFHILADGSVYKEVYGAWLYMGANVGRCENCGQIGMSEQGCCQLCGADRSVLSD